MATNKTVKGRQAYERGKRAEETASRHYQKSGFSILAKRFKTRFGEIDLVAKMDDLIVFVEVKARRSLADGVVAVPGKAQKRITNSATLWLCENEAITGYEFSCRFDVVIVLPDDSLHIVEGAFQAGS